MKKLIIVFVVFIFLVGGTVGLLKYLAIGPFKKPPVDPAVAAAVAAEKAKANKFFKAKPYYIKMDPIQVPVFQDNGVAGTILIHYKIEVTSLDNEHKVFKAKRQIGDALIQDFSYYIPRTLRNNKTLDVTLIKYRIMMIANRLLGKGIVNDALIQAMTSTNQ